MNATFVFIHSPLVGPATWVPVADALGREGRQAIVSPVRDSDTTATAYWRQEVDSVVSEMETLENSHPVVLVGHSGAGALLPEIGTASGVTIGGYIYVDAILPLDGACRLDEMASSSPDFAASLREHLECGNRGPLWTDDDLRPLIPADDLRRQVVSELQPRPLAFYEEPIPSSSNWMHAPSGYILFTPAYAGAAGRARGLGWPCREMPGGHFHMMIDPHTVAATLIDIADRF